MKWPRGRLLKKYWIRIVITLIAVLLIYLANMNTNWSALEKKIIMGRISEKLDIYVPKGMTAKVDVDGSYRYKKEKLERSGRDLHNVLDLMSNAVGIKTNKHPITSARWPLIKTNLRDAAHSFELFLSIRIVAINNETYIVEDGKLTGGTKEVLRWASIIEKSAHKYSIDPALIAAVMEQESGGNPKAISPSGAIGLMQLMPATARSLDINPYDPEQNIDGGAKYLAQMMHQFGNQELALAAYNSGPGNVYNSRYLYIPETMGYISNVPRLLEKYRKKI